MRKRTGFTLVELMVAMALTIFIMTILTQAFVISIETFTGLKGIGDMQANLRAAANRLRFDLAQPHFEEARRLSDPSIATARPSNGCFVVGTAPRAVAPASLGQPLPTPVIYLTTIAGLAPYGTVTVSSGNNPQQVTYTGLQLYPPALLGCSGGSGQINPTGATVKAPPLYEGQDLDMTASSRAALHVLQFSSLLRGNRQESFYTAPIGANSANAFFSKATFYNLSLPAAGDATLNPPPPQPPYFYRSQWAEIVYFVGGPAGPLYATGTTEEPRNPTATTGAGALPLFNLYRAEYVIVTDNTQLIGQFPNSALGDFASVACNQNYTTGFLDFYTPIDLALGGRAVLGGATSNPKMRGASLLLPNVLSFQVQVITKQSAAPRDLLFDSLSATTPILGVAITIRVWDNKTRQTRQMTIMQDL